MKSMQTFRRFVVVTVGIVLSAVFAFSVPTWTRVNYTSSTAFIGIVKINQYDKNFPITVEAGDFIGAFVGDECRMVAEVFTYNGGLYVSSVIQGGDIIDMTGSTSVPEEVEWKVWDNSANKLISAQVYGTLFTESAGEIFDFEIGKPNTGSELKSLSIASYTLNPVFSAKTTEYDISVPFGTTLPASTAYSAVAADSRASVNVVAATSFDATGKAETVVTVTAEDGSKTEYKITFIQESCPATAPVSSEIANVSVCVGDAATLTANFSDKNYEAVWYDVETAGSALETGNEFSAGKLTEGIHSYYVAKNDGTCESTNRLEVMVTVNPLPTPEIVGLAEKYCAEAEAVELSASVAGGKFSMGGTTITSFNPATASIGSNTIEYIVTDKNGCSGSASQTVTIIANPSITLNVKEQACLNESITLAPTTGTWSGTGVSGSVFKANTDGNFDLTYTETKDGCSSTQTTTIKVVSAEAPSVNPATVEKNGAVPSLTAQASGTVNWFESETGTAVSTGNSYSPTVSTATEKVFTFYASNVVEGCESEKVPVTLTVTSCTTEAPSIAPVDAVCEGVDFPTLTATGANITWYDAITDGNKLGDGANYIPTKAGSYYASQNPGCEGPRAMVKVEVKQKPTVPTAVGASSCLGSELVAMTTSEDADWYVSKTDKPVVTGSKSYTPSSLTSTTTFYVNRTENGCVSDFAEVVYTINPVPAALKTDNTKACIDEDYNYIVRVSGSLADGATLQWYDENDNPKGTSTIQDVAVTEAKQYAYSVTQTVGNCTSKPSIAILTVNALPKPNIIIESSYCSDVNKTVALTADLMGGDFMIDDIFEDSFVPSKLKEGQHKVSYTYEDENGCYGEVEKTFSINNCADPDVQTITLSPTTLTLKKNEKYSGFTKTLTPGDAPQTVTWESSDASVVTVDTEGNLVAVGAGEAVITMSSTYTPSKKATCTVKVLSSLESVEFNNVADLTVDEGGFLDLSQYVVINPSDVKNTTSWKVNSSSATISNSGVLTAGIVTEDTDVMVQVTVTSEDGTSKSASVNVTIIKSCSLSAPVVDKASQSICKGDEAVSFSATGDESANWIWENVSGAVVGETNSFKTAQAGVYYVYQRFGDCSGAKTMVTLAVNDLPQPSISLSSMSYCDNLEETIALSANLSGGTFSIDGVPVSAIDPSKLSIGKHTVTYAYTDKNNCSATAQTTFSIDDCSLPSVTSITLNSTNLTLQKDETEKLTVTIGPSEAPQTVNWTSSNPSVATVDEYGNITAVGKGSATITATSTYTPSQSAMCAISVVSPLTSVSFNTSSVTVMAGKSVDLSSSLIVNPSDATIVSQTWSTSSNVISVVDGKVVASNVQTSANAIVTVAVLSEEGVEKKATINVVVEPFTIDLAVLQKKIEEAQKTIKENEYKRGEIVGNIPSASFDVLQNAISDALSLIANPPSEQSSVDAQVIKLNSAIKTFLASEIPNKVSSISFESNIVYMVAGQELAPDVVFEPQGAFSDLIWTSSNSDVVRVYGSGRIVAQKAGSAAVTASLPSNMSISSRLIIIVSDAPSLVSVEMNKLGNMITLTYSEEMDTPDPQIYSDLYIYSKKGAGAMCNIMDVSVNSKNAKKVDIIVGAYIDDPSDFVVKYDGTSLHSKAGGIAPKFEYNLGSTPIEEIEENLIVAYPTIASDYIIVSGLTEGMKMTVSSADGKVVASEVVTGTVEQINVVNLKVGTYYIVVSEDNKVKVQLAFVKK